jgi:hypothetical protein
LFQWLKICIAFRPKDLTDQKSRSYFILFETSQSMALITEKRLFQLDPIFLAVGRFKDSTIVKGVVLYEHNPGPISNLIV